MNRCGKLRILWKISSGRSVRGARFEDTLQFFLNDLGELEGVERVAQVLELDDLDGVALLGYADPFEGSLRWPVGETAQRAVLATQPRQEPPELT